MNGDGVHLIFGAAGSGKSELSARVVLDSCAWNHRTCVFDITGDLQKINSATPHKAEYIGPCLTAASINKARAKVLSLIAKAEFKAFVCDEAEILFSDTYFRDSLLDTLRIARNREQMVYLCTKQPTHIPTTARAVARTAIVLRLNSVDAIKSTRAFSDPRLFTRALEYPTGGGYYWGPDSNKGVWVDTREWIYPWYRV